MEIQEAAPDSSMPETGFNLLMGAFDRQLDDILETCWEASQEAHLGLLAEKSGTLAALIKEVGDTSHKHLTEGEGPLPVHYSAIYQWADHAKGFLLLWRDILFEAQKAHLSLHEGLVDETSLEQLTVRSKEVVLKAAENLKERLRPDTRDQEVLEKQIKHWEKQENPWEVYRDQIEAVPEQCEKIVEQYNRLKEVSGSFREIEAHFNHSLEGYQEILDTLIKEIGAINEEIAQDPEAYNGPRLVSSLENIQKKELTFKNVTEFNAKLEDLLETLPGKKEFSIDTDEGLLLVREIDIRRTTSSWLGSETMSAIYNFYNIKNSLRDTLSLTILNIKNRVAFEKQEGQQSARKDIILALSNLLKNLESSLEKIEKRQKKIGNRTYKALKASRVFQPEFLNISMASTLNQYRRYQLEWWNRLRDWVSQRALVVKRFLRYARQEEILSHSEKIVRVVRFRTPQPENSQYTNMFLTKGYIGDSFCVGRVEELKRVEHLVENWKLGFRGAVLITGKRFSGKSFMGSMISNRYFPHKTIHIRPNEKIQAAGRHIDALCNLKEVLDFVVKYSLREGVLVWIDDLELWKDDKTMLSENIHYLLNIIDQYSGRIFFAVSMSNWLRAQLNQFYEIDKVFQSELYIRKMDIEEVKNAILIRHDATQMNLVDSEGEKLEANELDKLIKTHYKAADGNVGEVLRRWAFLLHKKNEDEVFAKSDQDYYLPDFISTEAGMLLRMIIMDKHSNEYLLRKRFGPAFKDTFQPFLQRFFNLGILKRHANGSMEINPFLVNEIGMLLEHNLTFAFHRNKTTSTEIKI